ncbi:MAG: flap endonuclease [Myxococcales bacterium FL481]|nr:MAG: flap endonuclease [Myxococcales bacterium FL481]
MPARLHVVDGTYELFRAHYSKRPRHATPRGRPAKATVGLVSSLLALLGDASEAVTHIAVAFDHPIESFRNDLFAGYKTGAGIDPELADQFDDAEAAVAALGIVVWPMDRWEADDALATAAARWRDDVEQIRILSPDKDLGQCIVSQRVVLVDRMRGREMDEAGHIEARGIHPTRVPDYLALVGDSADGIPGIPGFGAKTATALLRHYPRLDDIPADADRWAVPVRGAPRLAANLQSRRADALLYRRLATLVTDVPLPQSLDDLQFGGVPRPTFSAWARAMGAERLESRVTRWAE